MQPFPFGARGARPVQFLAGPDERARVAHLPGVKMMPGGIECAHDVAWAVAAILQRQAPALPVPAPPAALPGIERYKTAGFRESLRPYQKVGVGYLATRAYAVLADAMRLGKSVTALAAATLVGAKRALIICPETAKPVWRDEIVKWLGTQAKIATLYGRGADELRIYCHTCSGTGWLRDGNERTRCPDCKLANGSTYGYQLIQPAAQSVKLKPLGSPRDALMAGDTWAHLRLELGVRPSDEWNGAMKTWPDWDKLYVASCERAAQFAARRHVHDALEASTHVLCNYDLLVAQTSKTAAGKLGVRADLPGWSSTLAAVNFDVAIIDEAHLLRGFSTAVARRGQTRRDQCKATLAGVPQVWALTGTPIFGYVRDLWGLLDTVSNGLFGSFFQFTARWCEGHKDEYGWRADGSSEYVPELMERVSFVMLKRSRADVEADLPPQQYQIIRIEKDKVDAKALKEAKISVRNALKSDGEHRKGNLAIALAALTPIKIAALVENVLAEVAEGTKVVVFAYLRDTVDAVHEALKETFGAKDVACKMREANVMLWAAHGDQSADLRHAYATAFRAHTGGGAFVATIDSMQVAVSLGGAKTNHFVELHYSPAAILQAKERLNELGTRGITNVFYVVEQSYDEEMLDVLLPKMKTLEQTMNDRDAKAFSKATDVGKVEESIDDMVTRLTAHLADENV